MATAKEGGTKNLFDPMHQFEIMRYIDMEHASFTNSSLWMAIAVGVIMFFFVFGTRKSALIPDRMQAAAEIFYEFVADMVYTTAGKDAMRYFPWIFTLFIFILACNLLGLIPYSFTVTSHLAVTFALAITVFTAVTILGFARHGIGYLRLFVPHGVPMIILPLIVAIECISYLIRPFTLALRLFANMLAGHILLKILGGFVVFLGIWGGWVPLTFLVGVYALELLVAVLQAYIFAILTCIYLREALHMH